MRKSFSLAAVSLALAFLLTQCESTQPEKPDTLVAAKVSYNGFESMEKWGENLVTISACHDCHSPKKMTPMGMALDSTRLLAGHIAGSPEPDVDKAEAQRKGLTVTTDLTTWVGPWGTTYTANLTSDATGIGNWTEEQFITAIREGKYKGLRTARNLLPPMPWEMYRHMRDEELKAIYAYLKSTKPVKNVVPAPLPPVSN